MGLEIRHLYAFIAIADLGSMSKAAKALHVGQPSLSRTISQVERSVGHVLLDRSAAGCALTPKGGEFLARARRAVREFEAAVGADGDVRILTVGYIWSGLGPYTNEILRRWEAAHPQDRLMLRRFDDKNVGLDSGAAAFGIVRHSTPTIRHHRIMFAEKRLAAVAESHPLAGESAIRLSQFTDEVIVINELSGTMDLGLWEPSIRPSKPPIIVTSVDDWNHSVSLDRGVGVVADSTPVMHPFPGIRYIPIADAPSVPVCVVWQQDFYTDLCDRFAELVCVVQRSCVTRC